MKAYFTVVKFEGRDPEFFSTTENVVGHRNAVRMDITEATGEVIGQDELS